MRAFGSFLFGLFLLALPFAYGSDHLHLRGDGERSLQVIRTDLIRLIPFQVQMAIQNDSDIDQDDLAEVLYARGSLFTDTITDWMIASFVAKTDSEEAEKLLQNNYTSFDSIALELVDNSADTRTIDGQELNLVQLSYEGVTLWERVGTGTPPMEPENVELVQRATFLDNRSLKANLQATVTNLLIDLGRIESFAEDQPIIVVDVRAYIVPSGAFGGQDGDQQGNGQTPSTPGTGSNSKSKNLEVIIIVAIVVAVLAFALLVFAVVWAWKSDKKERDTSRPRPAPKVTRPPKAEPKPKAETKPKKMTGMMSGSARQKSTSKGGYYQAAAEPSIETGNSYDLPQNNTEIGNNNNNNNNNINDDNDEPSAYPIESVVSDDVSNSLSAYYRSGMGYNNGDSREPRNFNDNASLSSMDSYGFSLDGYAPSLGPAQSGYPVGPMAAARDAPMPLGQEEDSVVDYGESPAQ